MAGIAGVIPKHTELGEEKLSNIFASMMQKLSVSDAQLSQSVTGNDICFGNVVPVSCRINDHYQNNNELGIQVAIEGLVFVDGQERSILSQHYTIDQKQSDNSLIPFLYDYYKEDFATHVTGWFNIFIYNKKRTLFILVNDRLGFLPLYYYESDAYFVFASKIEAILNSGLLPSVKPDEVTVAEHLFFNYPLSDNTYIENIHTLANAELFKIESNRTTKKKYWFISELYDHTPFGQEKSFTFMNQGLTHALNKVLSRNENKINLSLTGGWDSRVVLSYLLPHHKDRLHIYSFGAEGSDDILIPRQISSSESLAYMPVILDQNYLDHFFISNALQTITLSGGTRNYKRTHYLYAVKKISGISDILVTGIFGDEVFKIGRPDGGEVISKNSVDLMESNFDIDSMIKRFSDSFVLNCLNFDRKRLFEAFRGRLERLKRQMEQYDSISRKFYAFRFEVNLRKYFGNEAASYNDFVFCCSPFIDYDFLKNFARTLYFGPHYSFGPGSLRFKKQSTQLYYDIVRGNYRPLVTYSSARGYSMKDVNTLPGNIKIMFRKYFRSGKNIDEFNTGPTDHLFKAFLVSQNLNPVIFKSIECVDQSIINLDFLSLFYWQGAIEKRYGG